MRIEYGPARALTASASDLVGLVSPGDVIGFSGFSGAGHPKAFPTALADRIRAAHERGEPFMVDVLTGASTAPDLDGVLAAADAMRLRTPYQADAQLREKINDGTTLFTDQHLSHLADEVRRGWFGRLNWAVVEAAGITPGGDLVPSITLGNNPVFLEEAERIVIEVNAWQSPELFGMHDVYYGLQAGPPNRKPIPILGPGDRIGQPTLRVDWSKVAGVILTDARDRNTPFKPLDDESKAIAQHFLDFLVTESKAGRLPPNLLPMESGAGNIPNAVMEALLTSGLTHLSAYTELIQDGMLALIDAGVMDVASATAISLSPERADEFNARARDYAGKLVIRPQEVTNNPEVIRRLGVIASNGMIEADIYGNVNSTHIMGSRLQNGLGGSGDFTRNGSISCFVSPSLAKGGAISSIVPFCSHIDHTEHDVHVIVTEQGLADLRGLAPRQRPRVVIEKCAHPDYRPLLLDYVERAQRLSPAAHTPHVLREAMSFHERYLETGTMMV
jgi:succinyl-CoA:acetate CoA-transferase